MVLYGLDFGTTFSTICFYHDNSVVALMQDGDTNIPTYLFFHSDGARVSYGRDAELCVSGNRSKGGFFRDLKRWIGCEKANLDKYIKDLKPHYRVTTTNASFGGTLEVPVLESFSGSQNMSVPLPSLIASFCSCLVKALEKSSGTVCTGIICSVPANYNCLQRSFTQNSVTLSGYECVRIINEPSAAALVASQSIDDAETCLLVYDFGGGTFDVSAATYVNNTICVKASGGDMMLGGRDVDAAIVDYLFRKLKRPPNHKLDLSRLKEAISSTGQSVDYPIELDDGKETSVMVKYTDIADIAKPFIDRTVVVLRRVFSDFCAAEGRPMNTTKASVILVGGSSSLPGLDKVLQGTDFVSGLVKLKNFRAAVAMGCALNSECLGSNPKNLLVDCAVKHISINAWNGEAITLVAAGSPIPFTGERRLIVNGASANASYTVTFFEGNYIKCAKNTVIHKFSIVLSQIGVVGNDSRSVEIIIRVKVSSTGTITCSLVGPTGVELSTQGAPSYDFSGSAKPVRVVADNHEDNFNRARTLLALTRTLASRSKLTAAEIPRLSLPNILSVKNSFSGYNDSEYDVCGVLMGKPVPKLLRGGRLQKLLIRG
ncbi:heat shock 70-like protein [Arracacha virus 1]|uniref:Heat shock 70-like protein n=1 Tax=Arracacha virus 1 TaxID=2201042 RepID=A0A2U8JH87_9CLOS|nr:heat shock 70-like protein [Arracacha virus 1]AWK68095.1 heat shock 70-like protein [Arracacha virus 1]